VALGPLASAVGGDLLEQARLAVALRFGEPRVAADRSAQERYLAHPDLRSPDTP
jgi:hypothetical protein